MAESLMDSLRQQLRENAANGVHHDIVVAGPDLYAEWWKIVPPGQRYVRKDFLDSGHEHMITGLFGHTVILGEYEGHRPEEGGAIFLRKGQIVGSMACGG